MKVPKLFPIFETILNMMSNPSAYKLLHQMDADHVILAYNGNISTELLDAVYSMLDKYLEGKKTELDKKKKIFQILIEALQNIFHHQVSLTGDVEGDKAGITGFIIKSIDENSYSITTGNYILVNNVEKLKEKIDHVNSLTPENLRIYYQQSLGKSEFSEKGGAGLGIIEMAKKSGKKLDYEFTPIDEKYSFFSLSVSIP